MATRGKEKFGDTEELEKVMAIIKQKNLEGLNELIETGWDVNTVYKKYHQASGSFGPVGLCDRERALIVAIRAGWTEGVDVLIRAGADIEAPDYVDSKRRCWSATPLMHAIQAGQTDMALKLIELGANVSNRDRSTSFTPLHKAAETRNERLVQVLLEKGAKIDVVGYDRFHPTTPLLAALAEGYFGKGDESTRDSRRKIINIFIEKGCDVNLHGEDDQCPLVAANRTKDYQSIKSLLAAGADIMKTNPDSGNSPLVSALQLDDAKALLLYIQHGLDLQTDIQISYDLAELPLMESVAYHESFCCVHLLINAGGDMTMDMRDYLKETHEWYTKKESEKETDIDFSKLTFKDKRKVLAKRTLESILAELNSVRTLKWLCRTFIRKDCRMFKPKDVEKLPLPTALKDYILCKDLERNTEFVTEV